MATGTDAGPFVYFLRNPLPTALLAGEPFFADIADVYNH
jgi:hypothetical protein